MRKLGDVFPGGWLGLLSLAVVYAIIIAIGFNLYGLLILIP